jgi:uncharacterized cupredoxin-like copper-binding protein
MIPRRAIPALFLLPAACAGRTPIVPEDGATRRAASANWGAARIVTVALDDYAFRPERIELRAGQPVRLRLANEGSRAHDFTASAFFRSVAIRPGDPLGTPLLVAGGSVDVPAGETREVALLPLTPGEYELTCVKPLHAVLGMSGRIVVTG